MKLDDLGPLIAKVCECRASQEIADDAVDEARTVQKAARGDYMRAEAALNRAVRALIEPEETS